MRVYETLRSAHLERATVLPPSSIFYRTLREDFDFSLVQDLDLIEASSFSMAAALATSDVRFLEINEPLMLPGLRRTVVALLAARVSARLRRRPLTVVSYAIENRYPFTGRRTGSLRRRLSDGWHRRLSRVAAAGVDRWAFGTDAARALYAAEVPASTAAVSSLIPALPAACRCGGPSVADQSGKDPGLVLFLGALTPRKGFDRLLAAWPALAGPPDAPPGEPALHLQIVGKGTLRQSALELAGRDQRVTVAIDPARSEVHAHLRRARVVVLLSQPTATWREQVGLPLVEALAHGCAVVTTTETGLAGWLAAHGHQVLPADADTETVAAAVRHSLAAGDTVQQILASLPAVDGRLAADAWLFGDVTEQVGKQAHDRTNGRSGSDTDDRAE